MNIVSLAEAKALAISSMKQNRSSERLFRLACSKFEIAIQATPDNLATLNTFADFLIEYAIRNPYREENMKEFYRAFEKYKTTKNYEKIYHLAVQLQDLKHLGNFREEISIRCYECIYHGLLSQRNQLWIDSLLGWGKILLSQARILHSIEKYKEAGRKFKEALLEENILKYKKEFEILTEKLLKNKEFQEQDHYLSILFEIYYNNKNLSTTNNNTSTDNNQNQYQNQNHHFLKCFDSSWCFDCDLISYSFLCLLIHNIPIKQLRLSGCKHLVQKQLNNLIRLQNSCFTEIELKNHPYVDDTVIQTIYNCCSESLTSLDVSGCTKIKEQGFTLIGRFTLLKHLNITNCLHTNEFINMFSISFSEIQSFQMSGCDYYIKRGKNDRTGKFITGLHDCRFIEYLNVSNLSNLEDISNLSSFPSLTNLDISKTNVKSLEPLGKNNHSKFQILNLSRNKNLDFNSVIGFLECSDSMSSLRKLDIRNCKFDNSHINFIATKCLHITHLHFCTSNVLCFDSLKLIFTNLTQLKELFITRVPMIEEVLNSLPFLDLPDLTKLSLIECNLEKSVSKIASCSNLQFLNLSKNREIYEEAFRDILISCPKISHLDISSCIRLTDNTIENIGSNLRFLESLIISKGQCYTNLNSLQHCLLLRTLNAEDCKQVVELDDLLEKVNLCEINVRGCTLSDSFLTSAQNCPSLAVLKICFTGAKISNRTKENFKEYLNSNSSLRVEPNPLRSASVSGLASRVGFRDTR